MRTGAVIIAAGHKSTISRFQPMLPVGDSTVIRRIIITLKRAGIEPVVVVTGQKADEVEKHIAGLRVICLRNQDYEQTQMYYSICMGLNYIEDLCDRVFVLPAKVPMFLPDTIPVSYTHLDVYKRQVPEDNGNRRPGHCDGSRQAGLRHACIRKNQCGVH